MELKPGYKKTEIGIIPEDWKLELISTLAVPVRGSSPRPAGSPKYFNGTFIPWLTVASLTNIPESRLVVSNTYTSLTEEGSKLSRVLQPDTLIIANSGATLGVAKILGMTCCANDGIAALLELDKRTSPRYLAHYINTLTDQLRNVVATGNGQPNLNTGLIGNIRIPIPPTKEEQEAIAEALSDVDELIESLEQLIAKKRLIKQGTMQALLSGKIRLPGFGDKWESRSFGEIARVVKKMVDPRTIDATTPCIELEHLDQGSGLLLGYTDPTLQASLKVEFCKDDVLFGRLRPYLRKFLFLPFDGVCSSEIWVLRPQNTNSARFLYYLVQSEPFIEVANLTTGTKMPRAEWAMVKLAEFMIPPTSEEQEAIGTLLADMDSELEELQTEIIKARKIKLGMMQQLLTGKIRLVSVQSNVIQFKPKAASASSTSKGHNHHFNEAIVISVLTSKFATSEYPLGRKRRTKLQYLLHRRCEGEAKGFLKKAAGPYNPAIRYKGAEAIAIKNGYVKQHKHGGREGFIAGEKSGDAQSYFDRWYGTDVLTWIEQFHYSKNDDLELLTTVDMAMVDLAANGETVDLDSVKDLINSEPEWAPKLDRVLFSDQNIERAIIRSTDLFGES